MRIRTGYSFRTAVGNVPEVMNRLQERSWKFAPITDRISTFGFVEWTKAAKAKNLKPIYGVELPVVSNLGMKKAPIDWWTFFATSNLRQLHDLIYLATSNPNNQITYKEAFSAIDNGLIGMAGECMLLDEIAKQSSLPENFFLGLSPSIPRGLLRAAKAKGIKLLATCSNYYPSQEDLELYRVMIFMSSTQTYPMHILSDDEWRIAVNFAKPEWIEEALVNRDAMAEKCVAVLEKASLFKPNVNMTLKEMCELGAKTKSIDLDDPVYKNRLDRELALIREKDFEDYFFIIADMIQWAKQRMIVGPARGSSCGSLVCYLLDITAIDPLKHDLIFERFIDTTRKDLPDIDIDFSDAKRHELFEYVEKKYGQERVARLGTVGTFQPRSAMKIAGAALGVPVWKTEKVLESLIVRSSGDSRALQQLTDTLSDTESGRTLINDFPEITVAGKMEGHPNVSSQHAAGILITSEPVRQYVAVNSKTNAAMCDKYDAETLNLLKIDALGLTQLSIFERALQLAGYKDWRWLENLALDDPAAYEVLNKGHYSGIFQFVGVALKTLTKAVRMENIEDIVSITALARPGPLISGSANSWVRRRMGLEEISYFHPLFEPYLKTTLGVVVYQEQVMNIGRHIGDLSWDDVTALRKAMSKSLGKEFFNQYGDRWKSNASKKGIPSATLDSVWDDLCAYGSWSFNRSHAVAYGLVSYWCCWLKAHHPLEFAAATLDAQSDSVNQIQLLREMDAEGVKYVPIDINTSTDRWEVYENKLVGPLTAVKGIGPKTVREILDSRRTGATLKPGIIKKLTNAKTDISSLNPIRDKIKELHPDLTLINIFSKPWTIIECQQGIAGEVLIFGVAQRIAPTDANEVIKVAKRGGVKKVGPTAYLNLFLRDDTDVIFCNVDRFNFERLGRSVVEKGRPGKSLYAVKGTIPKNFRMLRVSQIRYLGELDSEVPETNSTTGVETAA